MKESIKNRVLAIVWIHVIFGMPGMILRILMKFLDKFDSILGLENLLCMHINDSKNPLGAHKDRHENLGKGYIGFDVLHSIVHHPKLEHVTKNIRDTFIDKGAL